MTKSPLSRRRILRAGLLSGAGLGLMPASSAQTLAGVTPRQIEGPFYPNVDQSDKDADLTRVGDSDMQALGEVVTVTGRVLDDAGEPIPNAVVDIWQANAAGRYAHERDPNAAPLDPNFQGWAIMTTDDTGRYSFKTIRPGAYPAARGWDRPPHIHFKVARRGYHEITTQMYFDGEPLNDVDHLLKSLPKPEQSRLIARQKDEHSAFNFDIVLATV